MSVILETSIGDIVVDLYTQERPRCCLNFLKLCKLKYYNFCLFHSVQRGLVAQTGDPLGTGKGGESVYRFLYGDQAAYFDMEIKPRIKHTKLGQLSMVNNGVNLHGSQFFITLAPNIDYLDGKHTVFGEVVEGFEVLQKFNEAYVDQESRPYKDIRIYHSIIVDDPFDDPPGLEKHIPDGSPQLTREQLDSVRIGAEEDIDDMQGLKPAEIEEMTKERESKAHAQILEMIGDLPAADVAPPDNVLFVCKLNPVTTEDDLEIIFSRFGKIIGCEVIKDQKTGNSLQYAFIEFEKPSDCENAYFKMDNVLIDDRRIHVDFSQSVAKLKWKGKGKGVEHVQEKDEGPQFRIKNPDARRDNNYDFVFDDDNNEKTTASDEPRTKKPKKHKKQRSRSNSDDEKSPQHKHCLKEKSHRSKIRGSSSDGEDRKPHKKHKSTIEHKVKEAHGKHLDERRRPRSPSAEDHHRIRKNRSMSRTPPPRYSKSQSDCHEHHHRKDDRDRHGDSKHRATEADRRHRNDDSNTSSYRRGESSRSRRH